jgi:iron complex outermembrane recepter protein
LFANVDWDVSRWLTLKGGARYTESDRHAKICTQGGYGGGIDAAFDHLMSLLHGGQVFPPLAADDCITLDTATLLSVRQGFIDNLDEHNVSWRGGVDFKPTADTLAYIRHSQQSAERTEINRRWWGAATGLGAATAAAILGRGDLSQSQGR